MALRSALLLSVLAGLCLHACGIENRDQGHMTIDTLSTYSMARAGDFTSIVRDSNTNENEGEINNDGSNCPTGYVGEYCDECASEYYRLGQSCEPCKASNSFSAVLIIAFVIAAFFFILALILFKYVKKYILESSAIAIAINFAQMLGTLNAMDNVLSGNTKSIVNIAGLSNINLQLSRPECYSSTATYQTIWYARMALPFALFLPPFLISGGIKLVDKYMEDKKLVPAGFLSMLYRQIMLFLYVSVSTTTLELFDCTKDGGDYTLDASSDITCLKGEWFEMLPVAVAGVLFYVVGIPYVTYLIHKKHKHLRPKQYRDNYYGHFHNWELVILIRKLLLIVFSLYLNKHPIAFFICASLLVGFALYLHLRYTPFVKKRHNILDAFLLAVLIFFIIAILVLSRESGKQTQDGIFWTEVALIIIAIMLIAYVWIADMIDAYHEADAPVQDPNAVDKSVEMAEQPNPPTLKHSSSSKIVIPKNEGGYPVQPSPIYGQQNPNQIAVAYVPQPNQEIVQPPAVAYVATSSLDSPRYSISSRTSSKRLDSVKELPRPTGYPQIPEQKDEAHHPYPQVYQPPQAAPPQGIYGSPAPAYPQHGQYPPASPPQEQPNPYPYAAYGSPDAAYYPPPQFQAPYGGAQYGHQPYQPNQDYPHEAEAEQHGHHYGYGYQ